MATVQNFTPGLEGIIACDTAISFLDVEHEEIVIRGYDLIEISKKLKYLDLVYLLLESRLPSDEERDNLEREIKAEYGLPENVLAILKLLPRQMDAMDALRTGISALAGFDPELEDHSPEANRRKTIRLLARIPAIVANSYRAGQNLPLLEDRPELSYSANFLYLITGTTPGELEASIFDQSLMVYSEHEMPNSTFTARVIASTLSDIYGAVTGATASLKGKLHGGANEAVMRMLLEAGTEHKIEPLIMEKLRNKERIMGFGHRVYMKKADPRALFMKEALLKLCDEIGNWELYDMCVIGEEVIKREKKLYPNLDYYAAPVYFLLGIPIDLYTPIFLSARTIGLCSHVMEQIGNNRLFRPRVQYTGPRNLHP
ncbi:citrate synthase [Paenibacillus montanisoli]|uniref:Citrate synthase n=1 Tax=Paenibacillus montanisoli TaxID=2081970 RepID=A0A328UC26_9BACL|nr:citrate synthase [Paenibacillus montanisoli]RAP77904.1 citrate synthase [Paenibacillus montanisoli]